MSVLVDATRRGPLLLACLLVVAVGVAGVALAAGGSDMAAKKSKVKVKCPNHAKGKQVTCKVKGKLPKGKRGKVGPPGTDGADGVGGYEVVSDTFEEVFVENSGGMRGLSDPQTVDCPSGKRAIGGGSDLGTNETQNGQQRQVQVSSSAPTSGGDGWSVVLFNNSTSIDTSIDLEVFAICASAG